jgi:hypothetical protein
MQLTCRREEAPDLRGLFRRFSCQRAPSNSYIGSSCRNVSGLCRKMPRHRARVSRSRTMPAHALRTGAPVGADLQAFLERLSFIERRSGDPRRSRLMSSADEPLSAKIRRRSRKISRPRQRAWGSAARRAHLVRRGAHVGGDPQTSGERRQKLPLLPGIRSETSGPRHNVSARCGRSVHAGAKSRGLADAPRDTPQDHGNLRWHGGTSREGPRIRREVWRPSRDLGSSRYLGS